MTRQQEGDDFEARMKKFEFETDQLNRQDEAARAKHTGNRCNKCPNCNCLPIREDETTLPVTIEFYVTQEDRDGAREWIGMLTQDIPTLRRGAENCEWNYRAVKRELKTVLNRESATTARFDAKITHLEAERDALKARVEFDRIDSSHPATHCLRLLSDFNISVGKACEFLSKYFLTGKLDPIAEELHPYDPILDEISPSEVARKLRAAEVELSTLRAVVGQETPWIEIKGSTQITDEMELGRYMGKKWVISRMESEGEGWQFICPNDYYTHYRFLNPPPYTPPLKAGQ